MEEGLDALATLSSIDMGLAGEIKIERIPKPKGLYEKLLNALKFTLPTKIIRSKLNVSTKVKTRKQS
jgi:hypothetical protein